MKFLIITKKQLMLALCAVLALTAGRLGFGKGG